MSNQPIEKGEAVAAERQRIVRALRAKAGAETRAINRILGPFPHRDAMYHYDRSRVFLEIANDLAANRLAPNPGEQ